MLFSNMFVDIYGRQGIVQQNENNRCFQFTKLQSGTIGGYCTFLWLISCILNFTRIGIHASLNLKMVRVFELFIPFTSLILHVLKERDFTIPYIKSQLRRFLPFLLCISPEGALSLSDPCLAELDSRDLAELDPRNLSELDLRKMSLSMKMSSVSTEITRVNSLSQTGSILKKTREAPRFIQVQEASRHTIHALVSAHPPPDLKSFQRGIVADTKVSLVVPSASIGRSGSSLGGTRKQVHFSTKYSDDGGVYTGSPISIVM